MKHNPTINWITRNIQFDRCPSSCQIPETKAFVKIRTFATKSTELAAAAAAKQPKKTFEEIVPLSLHVFRDIFEPSSFDEFPNRKPWDHAIDLLPTADFTKWPKKIYSLSVEEQKLLDKFLEENLATGRIRPSKSPCPSPFFCIRKKDGSLRPVMDYKRINDLTVKDRYPLPLISEILDKTRQFSHFTKLDIRWGYNNVRLREGDEWKAAFTTNRGMYEPTVMFFGLTNSPATFQRMMNEIFLEEILQGWLLIYMDDIFVMANSIEENLRLTTIILEKCRQNKLFFKPEKCVFAQTEVEYLGLIISKGERRMDPIKTQAIAEWPIPQSPKQLRSFLGFVNYY